MVFIFDCVTVQTENWKAMVSGTGHLPSFFVPTPGHLDSSCVPTPGNLPIFLKKMLMPRGWALLELTDALIIASSPLNLRKLRRKRFVTLFQHPEGYTYDIEERFGDEGKLKAHFVA